MEIFIQPKIINNEIDISSSLSPLSLYLSKEKNELSNLIKDSEIIIANIETGEKVTLNSQNSYYSFGIENAIFTNKIKININKGNNALIEFLFGLNENKFEIITEKEFNNYRIEKSPIINLTKIQKIKRSLLLYFHNPLEILNILI